MLTQITIGMQLLMFLMPWCLITVLFAGIAAFIAAVGSLPPLPMVGACDAGRSPVQAMRGAWVSAKGGVKWTHWIRCLYALALARYLAFVPIAKLLGIRADNGQRPSSAPFR